MSFLQGNRDENLNVNIQQAESDAQRLYQAGEGKLGTDESSFNLVLASRSFPQLKAVAEAYARVSSGGFFFFSFTSVQNMGEIFYYAGFIEHVTLLSNSKLPLSMKA